LKQVYFTKKRLF